MQRYEQPNKSTATLVFQEAARPPSEEGFDCYLSRGFHPVRLGDIYGHYKIVRKLGAGSYSTVWLAEDVRLPCRGYLTDVVGANALWLSKSLPTMLAGGSSKLWNEFAQPHYRVHLRLHLHNSLSNCLTTLSILVRMARIFVWFSS